VTLMRIIDTHCHAGLNWFQPVETLLGEMERNRVREAVLIQHRGTFDNDYLFKCAGRFPGRFKVVVLVDPEGSDQPGTLEALVGRGAAGVRLFPGSRLKEGDPLGLWRKAGELGVPVSCLGDAEQLGSQAFKELVDACPDTTIVVEHLAGAGHAEPPYELFTSALELAERPNAYIKVPGLGEIAQRPDRLGTGFRFDDVPPLFEMAREAFGAQRMMWGSDFPPSAGREGYQNALEGVRNHPAFAGDDDLEWVLGRTAAGVWGFPADE